MIMKKYTLLILFLPVIFSLGGCQVRRGVARVSVVESTVERVEETIDTSRIYIETQTQVQMQEETQDNTFIRTTEFDTDGTVVRIREEFRDVRTAQLFVSEEQETHLYIADIVTTTVEREEIQVLKTEETSFDADARMIGRMWIVFVVAAAVLFLIILYVRKRWRR